MSSHFAMLQVIKVVLPGGKDGRKYREYGFVHFTERAQAVKAVEDFGNGTFQPKIGDNSLEVRLAPSAGHLFMLLL